MAKALPSYQFDPGRHLAGDIQICSLAAQGLYANIKAIYWIKGCELTVEQLEKRFNEQVLVKELIAENIIKIKEDSIVIDFLNVQYQKKMARKKTLSKAGRLGYLKKVNQATLKQELSKTLNKNQATPEQESGKKPLSMVAKFDAFLEMFNEVGNRQFKGDNLSRKSFKARINDGYRYADMKLAVTNLYKDPKHREDAFKYATPEFILRPSILERYINQKL
jgi:uncharacterized phage protein (TIGR02220 family)|tara:strand:- start:65 stop:727 length:663 start_codon:yes stop_codon:yes gene_type:complete